MGLKLEDTRIMSAIKKEIETNSETYRQMEKVGIGDYAIRQAVYSNVCYRYLINELTKQILLTEQDLEGVLYAFSFRIKKMKNEFDKIDAALAPTKYLFDEYDYNKMVDKLKTKVFNKNKKEVHSQLVSLVCRGTKNLLN